MRPVGHDPYRSHVPGYPAQDVQVDEQGRWGADSLDRVAASLADGLTVDDLDRWINGDGDRFGHVLDVVDVLAVR